MQALFYFMKSEGDTREFYMEEGRRVRSCGNLNCFNPSHIVLAKELKQLELAKMKISSVEKKESRIPTAEEMKIQTEEELRKAQEEIFKEFGNRQEDSN